MTGRRIHPNDPRYRKIPILRADGRIQRYRVRRDRIGQGRRYEPTMVPRRDGRGLRTVWVRSDPELVSTPPPGRPPGGELYEFVATIDYNSERGLHHHVSYDIAYYAKSMGDWDTFKTIVSANTPIPGLRFAFRRVEASGERRAGRARVVVRGRERADYARILEDLIAGGGA